MENHTPSSLSAWIGRLHVASSFLTRLPLPEIRVYGPDTLAASMSAFPIVGAAVGGFGGLIYLALGHFVWPFAAALVAVVAQIVMTGALHEDGLADFADGLGARGGKEARLAAMRDSHIGVFGALALMIAVVLRAALVASIPNGLAGLGAMIAAAALSRAAIPFVMQFLPSARTDGLGALAGTPDFSVAALAAVIAIVTSLPSLGFGAALAAIAGAALGSLLVWHMARRALGGFTGDVLGAVQQMSEIGVLIAVAALW